MAVVALFFFAIAFISCKKDNIETPNVPDEKVLVSFSPTLYGEVVPWVKAKGSKGTKGFTDFENIFFNHVVRIYKASDNSFVIDVPITVDGGGTCSVQIGAGNYLAQVIPIAEDVATEPGTYSIVGLASPSLNKAPIYTRTPVPFTVIPNNLTDVSLPCVTDYALLQMDFNGTYESIGIPRPEVLVINNATFLTAHSGAGNEQATFLQLKALVNGHYWITPDGSGDGTGEYPPTVILPGTAESGAMWFLDVPTNLYYMYKLPGSSVAVSLPSGDGTNSDYTMGSASYLAFGVVANTGQDLPVIWLKDYYASKQWIPNTTLRVSFNNGGNFTISEFDWFGTIITN